MKKRILRKLYGRLMGRIFEQPQEAERQWKGQWEEATRRQQESLVDKKTGMVKVRW